MLENPTLIMGLGGTGFHCISKIKKFFEEDVAPIPTGIRFLSIDFDKADSNKSFYKKLFNEESHIEATGDESKEWIRISSGRDVNYELSVRKPEKGADVRFFENNEEEKKRLLNTIGGFDLIDGAGQKRILGKIGISYSQNYERIKEKIERELRTLVTNNIEGNQTFDTISIFLVNSFSGGAGAGMFLDILFMLNEIAVDNKHFKIFTFNFLPDVFLDGLSKNIFKNLVEPNTFAAITELEYIYGNVDTFRPTHYDRTLDTTLNLPKVNFLINQWAYNGSKIHLDSMIYATSKTMFNILLSGNGLSTQWSNFQANTSGNIKGKQRIFGSLGYTEIVFDIERLKKFTIPKVLNKAWKDYNSKNTTLNNNITAFINYKENYIEHLLTNEKDESFREHKKKVNFIVPSLSKNALKRIKTTIEQNKLTFTNQIKEVINTYYDSTKITNIVVNEKNKIIKTEVKQTNAQERISKLKKSLVELKFSLKENRDFQESKSKFETAYGKILSDIDKIPKRFRRKYWFGVKSDFFKKYLPENINNLKIKIENEYADIILQEEVARLFNNDIDRAIELLSGDLNTNNVDKINWINSNKTEYQLKENYDNIIYLESYFQEEITNKINSDSEINASLIEKYLSTDRTFNDCIQHTDVMQYLTELYTKNLYELKELLPNDKNNQIINKIKELINPLWDRENMNTINNGRVGATGKLIDFNRVEVPALENNEVGSYFGEGALPINEGDIFPSQNKHRQSFIKLELGLPAYLIKSMKKYKKTFDDEIKENTLTSVNYFAYNENRIKTLNGDIGIFVFEDEDELNKQNRAIHTWAFGWATKILFKHQNRIKIRVSDTFKAKGEVENKVENGVYDIFKDLGQSTDLIKMFNILKEETELLNDIERQLNQKQQKSNRDFLELVSKSFTPTSDTDPKEKFRTEKKAYSQLKPEEKRLLNKKEKEALKLGCQEIADINSIPILFKEDIIDNESYLRMEILN